MILFEQQLKSTLVALSGAFDQLSVDILFTHLMTLGSPIWEIVLLNLRRFAPAEFAGSARVFGLRNYLIKIRALPGCFMNSRLPQGVTGTTAQSTITQYIVCK